MGMGWRYKDGSTLPYRLEIWDLHFIIYIHNGTGMIIKISVVCKRTSTYAILRVSWSLWIIEEEEFLLEKRWSEAVWCSIQVVSLLKYKRNSLIISAAAEINITFG